MIRITTKLSGLFAIAILFLWANPAVSEEGLWPTTGQNPNNTRHQHESSGISAENINNLGVKWTFTSGGDVSATSSVDKTSVYFPDWGGNLFALKRMTGKQKWSRRISEYTGGTDLNFSRTTPTVLGNTLILGDQGGRLFFGPDGQPLTDPETGLLIGLEGAHLIAVNKKNGELIWKTKVDDHPAAIITQSPMVFEGRVYVGVSSFESTVAAVIPGYPCCTFRGSVLSLDGNTGQILWKTYMAPQPTAAPPDNYSGAPVWGSTPVVDPKRKSLYIGTGNNYTVPMAASDCVSDKIAEGASSEEIQACFAADNHFDSIIALNLDTGSVKWATKAIPHDAWTFACILPGTPNPANCPIPTGPDFDFGQGPMLFKVKNSGPSNPKELLGIGQKSGIFWALHPDNGNIVWNTQVGPGGFLGGIMWGSATDGDKIYTAASDSNVFLGLPGTGPIGAWTALDAATGEILWQTIDPKNAMDQGALTVANGVVFAGSLDPQGHMYALDSNSGEILWSFPSGGSVNAGAAVVGNTVYWGSGYSQLSGFGVPTTGNNRFYAFEVND